jgi:hypothetical protein
LRTFFTGVERTPAAILLAVLAGTASAAAAYLLDPPALVAAVVGLVAAVLTLVRVEAGVLALIFVAYTRFSDVLLDRGAPLSIAELLVLLIVLAFVLRWYLFDEEPQGWLRPALLLAAYGLVGLASLLNATAPDRAQGALLDYAQDAVIVLLIVAGLQRPGALRHAVWALLGAGIFLGTLSVVQQMTGSFTTSFWGFSVAELQPIAGGTSDFRIGGPMGSPNFYAMILVPLVPLAFDRLWHERRSLLRLLSAWALVVVLLSIVFTFSRGGFIALAVVLGLTLLRLRRRPWLLLGIGFALLLLLALLPATYQERLATISGVVPQAESDVAVDDSLRGRTSELIVGWQMFVDHPLGGVGLDNYPEHYLSYSSQLGLDTRRTQRSPHSLYLEIASETGLVGIAVFLALLTGLFSGLTYAHRRLRQAGHQDEASLVVALAIGLTGYLVASLFLHAAYPRFFWTLAAIAFAAPQVAARTVLRRAAAIPSS